jgi:hypothetical protein
MTETTAAFAYIETTIPAGVTIPEYRVSRPLRVRGWRRIMQSVRPAASAGH